MTKMLLPQAPGAHSSQVCPPFGRGATPVPGVSDVPTIRRTAEPRPMVHAELLESPTDGYDATDRYVRHFWIPIVGPGAVADLLRLTAAAQRGRPLRLPINLNTLITEGFVRRRHQGVLGVVPTVAALNPHQVRRLPSRIRRHHQIAVARGVRSAA